MPPTPLWRRACFACRRSATADWYDSLEKPARQPPAGLFGPARTLIYALAATIEVRLLRTEPSRMARAWPFALPAATGLLNALWSLLFLKLRRSDRPLPEGGRSWTSNLVLVILAGPWDLRAAWLLVAYRAASASILNLAFVDLQAPFALRRSAVLQGGIA